VAKISFLQFIGLLGKHAWLDAVAFRGVSMILLILGFTEILISGILIYKFYGISDAINDKKKEAIKAIASLVIFILIFVVFFFYSSYSVYNDQGAKINQQSVTISELNLEISKIKADKINCQKAKKEKDEIVERFSFFISLGTALQNKLLIKDASFEQADKELDAWIELIVVYIKSKNNYICVDQDWINDIRNPGTVNGEGAAYNPALPGSVTISGLLMTDYRQIESRSALLRKFKDKMKTCR
jgi:hypothetical protein